MADKPLAILQLTDAERETDVLASGQKILALRKKGLSQYEVSRELDLPFNEIARIEEKTRDKIFQSIALEIEHDRHLAVGQLNDVIRSLREIADHSDDESARISALNGITKAIMGKSKIVGLETEPPRITNNLNINADEFMRNLSVYHGNGNRK